MKTDWDLVIMLSYVFAFGLVLGYLMKTLEVMT